MKTVKVVKVVTTTTEEIVAGKKVSVTTTVTSECTNDASAEAVFKAAAEEHDSIRKRMHEQMITELERIDAMFGLFPK